ncbi:MAG TPA: putative Ig domain-containing protein [Bryobacteraceae bacterium]|nr:putative Ig domain-containing protein [Bryobacteraceae bacterium]
MRVGTKQTISALVVVTGLFFVATGIARGQSGPTISPPSGTQPAGQVSQPYTLALTASNGSGNYQWSIVSEDDGLNLSLTSTTGANTSLTGTPTQATSEGGLSITVMLSDVSGESSTQATYTIPVNRYAPTGTQPPNTAAYVLNEDGSLVSVVPGSPNSTATSLAPATDCYYCYDMARDAAGNFIIAAGNQLTRYTGTGSPMAPITAPEGVNFFSVAVDASRGGNYIVTDNNGGQVFSIPPSATTADPETQVIGTFTTTFDAYIRVDASNNYVLATDDFGQDVNTPQLFLYRIQPGTLPFTCSAGQSTPNCTSISIGNPSDGPLPESVGGLTLDANGNYIAVDWYQDYIFRITPTGSATVLFSDPNGILSDPEGIYRDPSSGDFFLVDDNNSALYTLTPDGSSLLQILSGGLLTRPGALIVLDTAPPPPAYPPLSVSGPANLGEVAVGQNLSATYTASGGVTPYKWALAQPIPPGLSIDSQTGILTGAPQQPGAYNFYVLLYDADPSGATSLQVAVNVLGITTPASLPGANSGQAYTQAFSASGGSGAYTFSSPGAPAGLAFAGSTLSGVPSNAGTFTFPVQVSDGNITATSSFTLVVTPGPLSITSSGNLGEISLGSSVTGTLTATGGKQPYTWSASSLPAGVALNPSSGAFTGIPSQPGSYSFTAQVADAETPALTKSIPVTLQVLGLTTSATLPPGSTTTAYSQTFSATGGIAPYTFSSPAPPPGLSFSGATLTGTPSTVGTFSFPVTAKDAAGFTSSGQFGLVVTGPPSPITISGGPLSGGTLGTTYTQTLTGTGGSPTYNWTVIGGALPPGLSLTDSGGTIAGTPSAPGTYTFTAHAIDTASSASSGVFTITIAPKPLTLTGLPFPNGIAGVQYPLQVLNGAGGTAPYSYVVSSGSFPPGLTLANGQIAGTPTTGGTFSFTISMTDSGNPALNLKTAAQIVITPAGTPNLLLSSASLGFNLASGSSGLPVPYSVTVQSSVVQTPLTYSVVATPAVSWLDVTGGGTTPGSIGIALDPTAVNLGATTTPLTTSVIVTCLAPSPCAGMSQTIGVSLSITAVSPFLTAITNMVALNTTASVTSPVSQPATIENIGGGSAVITSATAADSWLTITGVPASVPANLPVDITLTANPSGLTPGFYRTTVTIQSSGGTITIPVTLNIALSPSLTLTTSGAQFQSTIGSPPPVTSGSFQVGSTGGTVSSFNASVQPGAPWLVLGGVSTTTGIVNYSIDPVAAAALTPAQAYYGTIQITANGVTNSPRNFIVILNVASATTLAVPDPEPAGLLFQTTVGASAPPPQTVTVFSTSPSAIAWSASASTISGGSWLTVSPAAGASSATSAGSSTVTASPGKLAAGIYTGSVSYQFSGAAVRSVNVTMIVASAGTPAGTSGEFTTSVLRPETTVTSCTPNQLVPTQTGLAGNFAQPTSWPTPLSIKLVSNCETSVANGQVVATFSNGDPPLALGLVNAATGIYSGTWTPRATAGQVTVTATVTAPGFTPSVARITGQVVANAAPVLATGGVLHIYDPQVGAALGQGTILQIYGSNLGAAPSVPSTLPLPTKLNGTQVIIGGIPAPLYYVSSGQIDAQLPAALTPGNNYQVIVNANGALSTPGSIQITAATPGAAAFPSGQIVAQHPDYSLVSETSPAKPGEYLVIYLSGLGQTNDTIDDGAASPADPLGRPLVTPILTLNGTSIPIYFSGLTPGYVGLYQMNFQVPLDTPNGDTQLVVSQNGLSGNPAILPVHN